MNCHKIFADFPTTGADSNLKKGCMNCRTNEAVFPSTGLDSNFDKCCITSVTKMKPIFLLLGRIQILIIVA